MLRESLHFAQLHVREPHRNKKADIAPVVAHRLYGEPVTVLAVSGFVSSSRHLAELQHEAHAHLPEGSQVILHEFGTKINLALVNIPPLSSTGELAALRAKEVKSVGRKIDELTDSTGKPIVLFGWSLGGVLGLEAWLQRPEKVTKLVAAGSPLGAPLIGVSERPSEGELHVVYARRDKIVPARFVTNGKHDVIEDVPGGHFALVMNPQNITTIVGKLPA